MKKLFLKLLLLLVPLIIYVSVIYANDIFNVFHYDNIRKTDASSDDNYIKTRYILEHPDKYNAFILGSSRVANLPAEGLPTSIDGDELSWYNMTYPMGCPQDNLETLKTFIKNGVSIRSVVIGIDEISMYRTYSDNAQELMYRQYQEYKNSPLKYYYSYLTVKPDFALLKKAYSQTPSDRENIAMYYSYGVELPNCDTSYPSEAGPMVSSLGCSNYSGSEAIDAIKELVTLCREHDIQLKVFTSPVLETTYREAAEKGYLDFLKDVSECTDFYNFSGLNEYSTEMRYYFDASHYRPYVGLEMERIMYDLTPNSDVTSFGAYINSENIDDLIKRLEKELL